MAKVEQRHKDLVRDLGHTDPSIAQAIANAEERVKGEHAQAMMMMWAREVDSAYAREDEQKARAEAAYEWADKLADLATAHVGKSKELQEALASYHKHRETK